MADPVSLVAEIQDHVKRTTAPYKYPRKVPAPKMIILEIVFFAFITQ